MKNLSNKEANKVTKEQVVKAAQTVTLDTVYQLTGKEEA